ncbi:oligosaccharide flippase family protein [Bacillaceae bacterium Marseille-Q3522]|nr:oligosaccharide flippase family protein [Bacillaceae bacterium Marseille-Q3522]
MRTVYSLKNVSVGIAAQIIIVLLGFVSRKVFVDQLGIEYLGIDGLLTNVLSVLALIESGIGISIVYNLYKPLAEKDQEKTIALIQLYQKAYAVLALLIFMITLCLYPFLGYFIKDDQAIPELTFIYFIFAAKNIVSFLNAHKFALINADQRGYVLIRINLLFQVLTTMSKITILYMTENYVFFLLFDLFLYIIQIAVNTRSVHKRYPFIKTKQKYQVDAKTKANLIMNVKAMFFHNLGSFLVTGTDNLLISGFIGLAAVGIYTNYLMIIQQLAALVKPVISGVGASIGNLIATETREKNEFIFNITFFVSFSVFSICVIFLYNLLDSFITWWLGGQFILEKGVLLIILMNFYLNGMRSAVVTFKSKAGLFVQDKYVPVVEGVINLIVSLILVRQFGLAGIFIGTTVSHLLTSFWTQPIIVFKHLFKRTARSFYQKYLYYTCLALLVGIGTTMLCELFTDENRFMILIAKGLVCLAIPSICYSILFYKTPEFQYLLQSLRAVLAWRKEKKKQQVSGSTTSLD